MGHRRSLGIPIVLEGIVMGVIWLASFNEGKFSEEEIELNVSIDNIIGIACKSYEYQHIKRNKWMKVSFVELSTYRQHLTNFLLTLNQIRYAFCKL